MSLVALVLAGLLAGLAVNWLADDVPIDRQLSRPHCHACLAPRSPLAVFGIVAFLSGRWHCEYCGRRRRLRLAVVELISVGGILWLHSSGRGLLSFIPSYFVFLVFLLIGVTDLEHRLIPHPISLPSIVLVGTLAALDPSRGLTRTLLGGAAGFGIVLLLYLFGELYSRWQAKRRGQPLDEIAFGFGDVTLATLLGVAVGWPAIVLALMVGVLSAGAFSILYIFWMVIRGRYQPHLPIPYGPFLILGGSLVFFGGSELFSSLLLA